jgi:hypothetical protein
MDAADVAAITDWFDTHSRYSYEMPEDPADERALEAAVDAPRINREILVYVLAQLGNSTNAWRYVLQSYGYIGVFHPDMGFKEARGLIKNLEREAKAQVGVERFPILEPIDKEEYDEQLKELAKTEPIACVDTHRP